MSLRVFALLTFLVAALSSFGQAPPVTQFPSIVKDQNPGFMLGVQESDATMFNTDVTGAMTINPHINENNQRDAFTRVVVRGRENVQMGESVSGTASTGLTLRPLFGLSDDLRNYNQARPTNAIFQAGPLYIQFHDVTTALLISDNVNFVPRDAHWGAIAELRLRLSGILQISPAWRIVVSGSIIYLPFNNRIGVDGFGIGDALGVVGEETFEPITHMQLAYTSRWADWDVQAVDDVRLQYVYLNGQANAFAGVAQQPEGIFAADQAGRYVFANGTTIPPQGLQQRQGDFLDIRTFLQLENVVAGQASRMLPTETRATFGASHSDYWYYGGLNEGNTPATNGLGFSASSADRVFAALRNERESMRFKPYAYYDAYRYNYQPNWIHTVGGGIFGPISDYLFLRAEGGYTWGEPLLQATYQYRISLLHDLGPYTREYLSYSRTMTEPVNEIRDSYRYSLRQVLGPDLWGRLYLERSVFIPNQLGVFESVEDIAGARIIWRPVPNHSYIIGGTYSESRFDNATRDRETTWEARAEIRYRYRPNLVFSFLYRYLNINTKQSLLETDTAENLWVLTMQKYF